MGQRIAWISNTLLKDKNNELIDRITFKIHKLNLNKGLYHVTTYVSVENIVADWLQNAFSFEIIEGDYHGSGKLVPQNQSKVLLDFEVNYK